MILQRCSVELFLLTLQQLHSLAAMLCPMHTERRLSDNTRTIRIEEPLEM
jgi:hypothetical protein